MAELEKLLCTDSKVESLKKINAIIDYKELDGKLTNCIKETPQRIKLELTDGVLTLKAGSVVTIPNGEGVFNEVTISDDISEFQDTTGLSTQNLCFVDKEGRLWLISTIQCFSGATKPTCDNAWMVWYDTVNNVINFYQSLTDHNTVTTTFSLPFAIGTTKGDGTYHFTSIDQVFNGMGYMGSTVWVDKGVKGLIPNGRNEDGTLNNIEFVTDKILVAELYDKTAIGLFKLVIALNPLRLAFGYPPYLTYNEVENLNWAYDWEINDFIPVGCSFSNAGQISNLKMNQPFSAIDFSNKSEVSSWSMPSVKRIVLAFGASGAEYIAPANGWFYFTVCSSASSNFLSVQNRSTGIFTQGWTHRANGDIQLFMPVSKGQKVVIYYESNNVTSYAQFTYAQGEV